MAMRDPMFLRQIGRRVREHMRTRIQKLSGEEGSISVLIIGLFAITVALLILITDLASMAVSKQSLLHATEAAAIRAVHSVDIGSYYRGGSGVAVPIDCQVAYQGAIDEISMWLQSETDMKRRELVGASLTDFRCTGDRVELSATAQMRLPFRLPQSSDLVDLHATVEAQSERIP